MEYEEYRFRSGMLRKKTAQAVKDAMVAASFTAWQIIRSQGGKLTWEKYLAACGLADREKISREEVSEATATARRILARQGKR
jgi:hypothetical protein